MALTKTVAEVKEMLPNFISNLSEPASLPNFSTSEYKYLVPYVGTDYYNDIHDKYNNSPGTMTEAETNVLKKMRLMTVAFAYHDGLALGHIKLTDGGARKATPANTTPMAKWEFEKVLATLITTAYDAAEVLVNFLFEIKPALWTASDEYKEINELLIRTGTDFSKQYTLRRPMQTFFNIRNVIGTQQELYIEEAIGKDLLKYILEKTDPDDSLLSCIKKLKKSLAFFTVKKCCQQFTVDFTMEGLTILSGFETADTNNPGRKSADPIDLDMKMKSAEKDGYDFLAKAKYQLWLYYSLDLDDTPDAAFNTAYEAGPLAGYSDPQEATSGNETRKGIFRLGR